MERGENCFGGMGMSVELLQIFDVLDFTYVGLHASTDAKDIFFEIAFTYVGLHTSTDAKDIFLNYKKKKSFSR